MNLKQLSHLTDLDVYLFILIYRFDISLLHSLTLVVIDSLIWSDQDTRNTTERLVLDKICQGGGLS